MKLLVRIVVFFLLYVTVQTGFAQTGRDKVETLRVEYISKSLELTNAEYEKFWPVYNEYNDKIRAIRRNLRLSYRNKPDNLSEKEAEQLYYLFVQSKQAEAEVHKIYNEKIRLIIGTKKTVKLHVAEEEFRMKVMKSIKGDSD